MPEKEYIERGAAIQSIRLTYCKECNSYNGVRCRACEFDDAMLMVEDVPAADVVEVVHAEWEFRNDGRYGQTRCYCPACGKHSGIGGIRENQMKPFCPNCGAKMDGDKHDGK